MRTLENKIYKHITWTSKSVDIDKLDDLVPEFDNTYHSTIKMKPAHVKASTSFYFNVENNDKNLIFKECHVRISKYKDILVKDYTSNKCEQIFVIIKVKDTVPWRYVIEDLNREEIAGKFYEKVFQKVN